MPRWRRCSQGDRGGFAACGRRRRIAQATGKRKDMPNAMRAHIRCRRRCAVSPSGLARAANALAAMAPERRRRLVPSGGGEGRGGGAAEIVWGNDRRIAKERAVRRLDLAQVPAGWFGVGRAHQGGDRAQDGAHTGSREDWAPNPENERATRGTGDVGKRAGRCCSALSHASADGSRWPAAIQAAQRAGPRSVLSPVEWRRKGHGNRRGHRPPARDRPPQRRLTSPSTSAP